MNREIFISYAWGDDKEEGESREAIVDAVYDKLNGLGMNIIRDKKDLNYKDNIHAFENRIGSGDYIILVISDKFLRSRHCMYEVLRIAAHKDVYKRIFPIVLSDARIYDKVEVLDYIDFWNSEIERLQERIKRTSNIIYTKNVQEQLRTFGEILRLFDDFVELIQEMNTLSPAIHQGTAFSDLEATIRKQIEADLAAGQHDLSSSHSKKQAPRNNITISETGIAGNNVSITGEYVAGRDLKITKQ